MLLTRKSVLGVIGAACLVFLAPTRSAHADADKLTLALPQLNLSAISALMARALGTWKNQGLDVDIPILESTSSQLALSAGDVELSISSGTLAIAMEAHNQHILAIGDLFNRLYEEIVISKKAADASGLKVESSTVEQRAKVLKGLRIAVSGPNAIADLFLTHIAMKGGVAQQDIERPNMPLTSAVNVALAQGKIDGFIGTPPYTTKAVNDGTGVVWISGGRGDDPDVENFIFSVFTARAGYCEKNPTTCTRFMTGIKQAVDFMRANPEKSLELLAPSFKGMDPAALKEGFYDSLKIIPPDLKMNESEWQHTQDFDLQVGFITPAQKLSKFEDVIYTNKYLPN